jgi:shikimate kinase
MRAAPRSIVLVGFMGTGKSSVGRLLARQYGWPRFDTDEIVAATHGISINEIFAQLGEAGFREAEAEVVRKLEAGKAAIIVTGGGIVLRPQNVERLRQLGTVVCLTAELEILQQRLSRRQDRPLLQTENPRETITMLFEQRKNLYEQAADFVVDTTLLNHEQVAEAIRDELQITR